MQNNYRFIRRKGDKIWEVNTNNFGTFEFTFDKKKIYNFWTDYEKLTDEEREIFDKEKPVMASLKNPDIEEPPDYPDDVDDEEVDDDDNYEFSD